MKKVMWKYLLKLQDTQRIKLPKYAEIRSVGLDPQQELCFWALVNPDVPAEQEVMIYIYGTGHTIPADLVSSLTFLGSVLQGNCVWHIFAKQP